MSVLLSNSELNLQSLQILQVRKNEVQKNLLEARKDLAQISDSSFIHRMAGKFYGVNSSADLTEEQIGSVSLFFVLSVAFVVAISGPLLAFCSMKIRIEKLIKQRKPLSSSMRKALLSLRRRLNKPKVVIEIKEIEKQVEKIVEVEVEKKVYETIEIPTPYEVTKFVAVPVPTELKDLTFAKHLNTEVIERNEIAGSIS